MKSCTTGTEDSPRVFLKAVSLFLLYLLPFQQCIKSHISGTNSLLVLMFSKAAIQSINQSIIHSLHQTLETRHELLEQKLKCNLLLLVITMSLSC